MYVLVAVVVLLLALPYYARARRQHLAATVAATRTRGDYLPEAVWHLQAHDGLSPTKARALRACRTTAEVTAELTADRRTAPREASVLLGQVRARRVSEAAILAHRGLDTAAPALDGVLSELGTHLAAGAFDRAAPDSAAKACTPRCSPSVSPSPSPTSCPPSPTTSPTP